MERGQEKNKKISGSGEQDRDLPGYPHYPPEDDIMNPQHGFKKIHADEELANSKRLSSMAVNSRTENPEGVTPGEDDLGIVRGTEADVTREDLELLGDRDNDQDFGDDELITAKGKVDDLPEEGDLDVPGSDLDDREEDSGAEDEENNYYSLGGDRHENLEEDQS